MFTQDNTEGYSPTDLRRLNKTWDRLTNGLTALEGSDDYFHFMEALAYKVQNDLLDI